MKRLLSVLVSVVAGMAGLMTATAANKLYIVPADESGKVVKNADGGYAGQVEMVQDENSGMYIAKGVEISYPAFAIYGINENTGLYTFYDIIDWAVSPVPVNYPSPLVIAAEGAVVGLPVGGRFDFEFYDRNTEGVMYHMIVPVPADESCQVGYPSQLYLIDSSNGYVALQGGETTGIYEGDVNLPDLFRISYEPRYNIDAFVFGPASGQSSQVDLSEGESVPIAYARGTSSVFHLSDASRSSGPEHVKVNLPEGYILVGDPTPAGLAEISSDSDGDTFYTLSGVPLPGKPISSGFYIVKNGDRYSKIAVRL